MFRQLIQSLACSRSNSRVIKTQQQFEKQHRLWDLGNGLSTREISLSSSENFLPKTLYHVMRLSWRRRWRCHLLKYKKLRDTINDKIMQIIAIITQCEWQFMFWVWNVCITSRWDYHNSHKKMKWNEDEETLFFGQFKSNLRAQLSSI